MKMSESIESDGAVAGTARVARHSLLKGAVIATAVYLGTTVSPLSAQQVGPGTAVDPYVLPSMAGVKTTSMLTVGDLPADNGYRMVGIPDGLGAFRSRDNFTLLMNHELGGTSGIVRGHGSKGAYVSRWTIDRNTLEVLKGEDHTQSPNDVYLWDSVAGAYFQGTTVWQRLCSADLATQGAYRYRNLGTRDRIYLNGEEVDTNGRAWAQIATGQHNGEAWELPRLGKIAWENAVASSYPQRKTIVMGLDDGDLDTVPGANDFPSEVYVYIGNKQRNGHPVERAGLTNGKLYGMKVFLSNGTVTEESDAFGLGNAGTGYIGAGRFELVELSNNGDVSSFTSRQLQDAANAKDIFRMRRVEDGAWDSRRRNEDDFYFVTTADVNTNSRLWRLRFDDLKHPENGGSIENLLRGDEGHRMLDNLTIDGCGRILMQEDPGNNARIAKLWLYGIQSGNLVEAAHHNPQFFDLAAADQKFLTQDEESSGIIDAADILGKGWFLLDVQAHLSINPVIDPELVQHGQLLAMFVDRDIECAQDKDDDDDDRDGDD